MRKKMLIREKENDNWRERKNYLTSKMCKMGKTAKLPDNEVQQTNSKSSQEQ